MTFHDNLLDRKGRHRAEAKPSEVQIKLENAPLRSHFVDVVAPTLPGLRNAKPSLGGGYSALGVSTGGRVAGDIACSSPSDPPFTVRTLAERWDCSEGTVRNLIREGALVHFRIGGLIRIPAQEVGAYECRNWALLRPAVP